MTELRIGDQTIRYDREATEAIYTTLKHGFAEECGCVSCQDFVRLRSLFYPASFRVLLDELGADPNKEGEVYRYGPLEDGGYLYEGWFHIVGEMVTAGERNYNTIDSPQLEFYFNAKCADAPAFRGGPALALEFTTRIQAPLPNSPIINRQES